MGVELDNEAKKLLTLFEDYDKFNNEFADKLAKGMVKNQDHSPLQNRFQRSAQGNKVYRDLRKKTKTLKKRKGEKYVMQQSGDTKRAVKRTIKGEAGKRTMTFTADVPQYAADWNNHPVRSERLEFFSLNGKNGSIMPQEEKNFERVAERIFNKLLSKFGIKGA